MAISTTAATTRVVVVPIATIPDLDRRWSPRTEVLLGKGTVHALVPQAGRAAQDGHDELRVVDHVPAPQPAWLHDQSEAPLEPGPLDPMGRLAQRAGVDVERRAHAEE